MLRIKSPVMTIVRNTLLKGVKNTDVQNTMHKENRNITQAFQLEARNLFKD